jgi:hypothetical protein
MYHLGQAGRRLVLPVSLAELEPLPVRGRIAAAYGTDERSE